MAEDLKGVQKAAILLIALGPEKSSMIFKHLKEEEIEDLTLEIANTKSVTSQLKERVINEFYEVCLHSSILQKVVLDMPKNFLRKHLALKRQWMLSAN